jgi:Eukaryotic aspartyl protease
LPEFLQLRSFFLYNYSGCSNSTEGLFCDCEDLRSFPSLIFTLNGSQFPIPPTSYFQQNSINCKLLIGTDPKSTGSWRLGEPFLRRWYSVFDIDGLVINLFPSKISHYSSHTYDETKLIIIVFFIILVIAITLTMVIFFYWFCCTNRKTEEDTVSSYTARSVLPPGYYRSGSSLRLNSSNPNSNSSNPILEGPL